MKRFKKPYEVVDFKGFRFVLYNGTETKSVFGALPFDEQLGVFPIINKCNEIVEYMDCLGNFTKKPTQFARDFNKYINETGKGISFGFPVSDLFYTSLLDLPSKYLTSKKIREIVKNEENYKIQRAKSEGEFFGLIELVRYKLYISKIYKQKLKKALNLLKDLDSKKDVENLYFNL